MRRARPIWPLSRASLRLRALEQHGWEGLRWAPTSPSLAESEPAPFADRLCCRCAEQQQQALRDAFITDGNLVESADGLGTTLSAAYEARAHHLDRERFASISKAVSDVIAYANSTCRSIFSARANISSPMARRTAKNRSPTRPWPSSPMSTAHPILLVRPMADRGARPTPAFIWEFPGRSDRTYGSGRS